MLIPLCDSERRLAKVLLSQPEKMVSTEEALKKMHERAKKKRNPQQATSSAGSPVASPLRRVEKRKAAEPSEGRKKDKRVRKETIDVYVDPISVGFPSKTLLWKNPDAFAQVLPRLVFEADQPIYEKLREIRILECTAHVTLQVNI